MDLSKFLSATPAVTLALAEVESVVASKFASESELFTDISNYLLGLGGKRIRPLLTLLSAQAFGMNPPSQQVIDVAAGIELIHMATLLHDDIIDGSPLRRHMQSPLFKYGMPATLLCGDFLLTRAFSLCARLDNFTVDATEKACIALTEGEIDETPLYQTRHDLASSISIARKKTASLFALACQCGAHFAGGTDSAISAMHSFGENLGIAFQILDDILDVTSTAEQFGKQAGIDIRERKPSVVNVLWLEHSSEAELLLSPPNADENLSELLVAVNRSAAVSEARAVAAKFANQAAAALEQARASSQISSQVEFGLLLSLIEFVQNRLV